MPRAETHLGRQGRPELPSSHAPLKVRRLIVTAVAMTVSSSCATETPSSEPSLTIAVAPLNLPAVGRICYDLRVSDGPTLSDPAVWSRGTPGLNGGTADAAALCSSSFGNGTGGDITFVGACVASPPDAGQNYRTNSVTLWIDGVYDASNTYISPTGSDGWQNPCPTPGGCTITAACRENADTVVEFNLTILRQANQGFFDIGVNFEDIFCSAKVDCRDASGSPLKLLFKPGTSTRDTTVVSALACTAGPGSAVSTVLYRDALTLTCPGSAPVQLDVRGKGNAWTTDPTPTDAVFQYAVYAGQESLTCSGQPCKKQYWNVALGLDLARANNCTLTSAMTASNGDLSSFTTPNSSTYPYIAINVPLTTTTSGTTSLACTTHELNGGNGVSTAYTPVSLAKSFLYDFDGTNFGQSAASMASAPSWNSNLYGIYNAEDASQAPSAVNLLGMDHATLVNGTTITDGKLGKSFTYDGIDDHIRLPDNSLNFTGDFSYSFWVKTSDISRTQGLLDNYYRLPPYTNYYGTSMQIFNGGINFDIFNSTATEVRLATSGANLQSNIWYHIVISRKASTRTRIYVNGVLNNSNTSTVNPVYSSTHTPTIGSTQAGTGLQYPFVGQIDAVAIWQRELTQTEVTALYNSGTGLQMTATPIVTNGLVLNLDASRKSSYPNTGATWKDISGSNLHGSILNGPIYTNSKDGTFSFDGVNDYVTLGSNKLRFQDSVTVEAFVKFNALPTNTGSQCAARHPIVYNHDWGYNLLVDHNGKPSFGVYNSISSSKTIIGAASVIGQDVHLVGVKNGTSVSLYINGVLEGTQTLTSNAVFYFDNNLPFVIGGSAGCGGNNFFATGQIGLVKVYNRALSATEIDQNFDAHRLRYEL